MAALAAGGGADAFGNDWTKSAGDFACSVCRRKRLPAGAFSKTQAALALRQSRQTGALVARCKQCVAQSAAAEQARAKAKRSAANAGGTAAAPTTTITASTDNSTRNAAPADVALLTCAACSKALPPSSFSGSQRNKIMRSKPGRCLSCVAAAEAAEAQASVDKKAAERAALEKQAKMRGAAGVAGRLALAAAETAAEAEIVTGIKAKGNRRRARGGGGGRWRGRGRGRGRGRR